MVVMKEVALLQTETDLSHAQSPSEHAEPPSQIPSPLPVSAYVFMAH